MGHGQVGRPEGPPSHARLTPAPRAPTIVPMAQTYTFPIPPGTTAAALLAKVREAGRAKRLAFSGDDVTGRFTGPADGTYAVEGDAVKITVEKKPMIVPWGMIESALKDLFKG